MYPSMHPFICIFVHPCHTFSSLLSRRLDVECKRVERALEAECVQRKLQDDRIIEDAEQMESRRKADVERIDDTLRYAWRVERDSFENKIFLMLPRAKYAHPPLQKPYLLVVCPCFLLAFE